MLNEDADDHAAIRQALIWWHRNNALPVPPPAGMAINGNFLEIDYGYGGSLFGRLRFTRGQFELTEVTDATGAFHPLRNYNHAGNWTTWQDFIDALKETDIAADQGMVSRMIILTAECARSELVLGVISRLLRAGHGRIDDAVWAGLQFAFNNYNHTCRFRGYDIAAGGAPWTTLRAADYIAYVESPDYTGARDSALRNIRAAADYAAGGAA